MLPAAWVDIALLAFLALSVAFGLARGLVFEVLSAAGWIAAYFAARWLTPDIAPYVPVGSTGTALNHGVAFAAVFLAALIAWGLGARLLRTLIRATPLSSVDRLLGAGFGLLRGVVVLLAFAAVIGLTPLDRSPAWRRSEGAAWLVAALQNIRPLLPPGLSRHLPA